MEWWNSLDGAVQVTTIGIAGTLLGVILTVLSGITIAAINNHKPKEKTLETPAQPKKMNLNYSRGEAYSDYSKYEKALQCFTRAAEEYKDDSFDRANALIMVSGMYFRLRKYDEAFERILEAKAICYNNKKAKRANSSTISFAIAGIFYQQEKHDESLLEYLKAYRPERYRFWRRSYAKEILKVLRTCYEDLNREPPFDDWLKNELKKKL